MFDHSSRDVQAFLALSQRRRIEVLDVGRGFRLAILMGLLAGAGVGAERPSFPEFKAEAARDYLRAVVQEVQLQIGSDGEALLILARIRSQLGQKDEAERLAWRALQLDPNRVEVQLFLAELLIHQDRLAEAAGLLRRAVELRPGFAGTYRRLGMVLDRFGDREGARRAFETGIQLAPEDATARLLLGRLLLAEGKAKEGAAHLAKACELDTKLSGAFYALSQAQSRLGDQEAALDSLRKFQQLQQREKAELDARNESYDDEKFMRVLAAGFHTEVARYLVRQNRLALAEGHLRQAVQIAPREPQGHEMLAALLLDAGRAQEARPVCEALVRLAPNQAAYRANLGTVLLQLKEYPAAVVELKRALELDPEQPVALNNLARFYLGAGRDLAEALDLCHRLVALRPTAANYDLLGWASYANGLTNEARAAAALAVEKDPTNAVYRERYRRLGERP